MDTRVTLQTLVNGALSDTRRLSAQLASLQTQAATGKKFQQISDDPATALTVLNNDILAKNYNVYLGNIATATSNLNASTGALQDVSGLLSQARSLAVEASSSVNDATTFESYAKSVDGMLDQLLKLANSRLPDGSYSFGGIASRTAPFVVTQTDAQGRPVAIQYQGASDATSMFVNRSQQVDIDYAGDQVFQQRNRQPTVFTGNTGAAPGTGTDSATLRSTLVFAHTATTYSPGSGVQAGANSAAGDTVLGVLGTHQLHITDTSGTGAAGTVSLDGSPAVAFTSADTNLAVTNANGDVVYLNMSAITANFDGNVAIAGDGTMSIDGGATSTPINFSANQVATDSTTGAITNVNTSNVQRAGTTQVTYPGTADIFQSLMALRDDLRNTRGLSQSDQIQAISNDLGDLEHAHSNVLLAVGTQGAAAQSLQSLQSNLQDMQLNAKTTSSNLGDADISDIVVKLQSYQNMMQLSLATFSRIMGQNLLDFLK